MRNMINERIITEGVSMTKIFVILSAVSLVVVPVHGMRVGASIIKRQFSLNYEAGNYGPFKKLIAERMELQDRYRRLEYHRTLYLDPNLGLANKELADKTELEMKDLKEEFEKKEAAISLLMHKKLWENDSEQKTVEEIEAEIRADIARTKRLYHYRVMLPEDVE